ncbi:hypothetical protein MKEN_00092300 [Mycena kentingensis (nom. inval.)]|nr:hypothetical protein MKEN_00092300 [Mycena kentingensis (nom. inval.)]
MEDDPWGSSAVWGSSTPVLAAPSQSFKLPPSQLDDGGDDFTQPAAAEDDFVDDFGDSAPVSTMDAADDDFGDFGDFDDGENPPDTAFASSFAEPAPPPTTTWEPLRLDPMPRREDLQEQVEEILRPVWRHGDVTTNEDIRQVEGITQILSSPSSRETYTMIFQSPPPTKAPNWTRSRIRRQHLITLGIPVNLDEVLPPQSNGHPLPPIQVSTRPMSAPPGPQKNGVAGTLVSRSGTPQPQGGRAEQFGPKPDIDNAKIAQLLALDQESLSIQPLNVLEGYLASLRAQTASTSTLLSHLLQTRDSLQQDSETYNKLIAELVADAQKKTIAGKGRTPSRKGSGMS